jgi:hypothetical protein
VTHRLAPLACPPARQPTRPLAARDEACNSSDSRTLSLVFKLLFLFLFFSLDVGLVCLAEYSFSFLKLGLYWFL